MARFSRNIAFFLILFFTISYPLNSQSIDLELDVLPVVTARCVFHDSFGFIWIGTYGGLVRYDGYDLKQYSNIPFDSTSLSNNWVMAINEDSTGNLWIGTFGGGLNYFNRRTETFEHYNSRTMVKMSDMISKIIVNESGSLWIASIDNGLNLFWKDHFGQFQIKDYPLTDETITMQNQSDQAVLDLYKDKEGIIWIASATQGVIKFNQQAAEMKKYKHDPENPISISSNTVSCIAEDDAGNLWMGTGHPNIPPGYGNGLNMFSRKTEEFKHFTHNNSDKNSICSNTISSLLIDKNGTLWIGSIDNYLNSISNHDLISNNNPSFVHHKNLARDAVISLYEDKLDNIWIGVFGIELYKIDRQRNAFDFYSRTDQYPNSLTHSAVSAICADHSGKVIFGTRGLDIYNPETKQYSHYYSDSKNTNGLSDNIIAGIKEDNKGLIWIATKNGGISIYNPNTGLFGNLQSKGNDATNKISNFIQCLLKRPNGDFWIATADGRIQLYEQSTGFLFNYELETGTNGNLNIYALCEDKDGILWIGTMHSGMYSLKIEGNKVIDISNYRHNPKVKTSLSNNWVSDIINPDIADTSALWIATNIGLNRFDLKTKLFTHFFHDTGLASDLVLRILEDNLGNIWCATINGISVYNIKTGKIKSYGKGDGMPFTDFSNLGQNAAKGPDGRLFFGGLSGALSFMPQQLTNNPNIPPIMLTDFRIFHESVNLDTAIQFKKKVLLPYNQNAISFEFSALNFTNPEKNQYAYKMEGLIEDWISIGNERTASFTNLDPGEYVFWVKGSNNHGIWNEEGTSVKVVILSPWWRTNLANIFYIFLTGFVLWLAWHFQTNRLKMKQQLEIEYLNAQKLEEVDRLKSRFFTNISHEFRTPLTLILSPIEQLITDTFKGNIKESYFTIRSNAKKLLRLVNQLLSLSKLEAGQIKLQVSEQDIIPVFNRIINLFSSLAEGKNIDLKLFSPESLVMYFDEEKIETILNNLLSNAFKFTPDGGEIEILVSKEPTLSRFSGHPSEEGNKKQSPLLRGDLGVCESIEFKISNTGPHISANELEKIFDRFYQVESHNHTEGTGIGLSLAKDLVELHHGQITVESKPGEKTTFKILIPSSEDSYISEEITEQPEKGDRKPDTKMQIDENVISQSELSSQPAASDIRFPSILLVEDNQEVRSYLRKNLQEKYNILEAANGKIGIQVAEKELPDLIISDVMMPEMDGIEFCDKIKTDLTTSHIPVILLTAKATREDKLEGLKTGADEYLPKPFDLEELTVRVENLIHQRKKLKERFLKEALFGLDQISSHKAEKKFVEKITEIINQNIDNPNYTVDNFAHDIGMSRAQLFRKVKAWTNITPHDFIRLCRLKKAAIMLKEKSHNVTEAAFAVGFKSVSHFSKAFNAQFNQSPGKYFKS